MIRSAIRSLLALRKASELEELRSELALARENRLRLTAELAQAQGVLTEAHVAQKELARQLRLAEIELATPPAQVSPCPIRVWSTIRLSSGYYPHTCIPLFGVPRGSQGQGFSTGHSYAQTNLKQAGHIPYPGDVRIVSVQVDMFGSEASSLIKHCTLGIDLVQTLVDIGPLSAFFWSERGEHLQGTLQLGSELAKGSSDLAAFYHVEGGMGLSQLDSFRVNLLTDGEVPTLSSPVDIRVTLGFPLENIPTPGAEREMDAELEREQ